MFKRAEEWCAVLTQSLITKLFKLKMVVKPITQIDVVCLSLRRSMRRYARLQQLSRAWTKVSATQDQIIEIVRHFDERWIIYQ